MTWNTSITKCSKTNKAPPRFKSCVKRSITCNKSWKQRQNSWFNTNLRVKMHWNWRIFTKTRPFCDTSCLNESAERKADVAKLPKKHISSSRLIVSPLSLNIDMNCTIRQRETRWKGVEISTHFSRSITMARFSTTSQTRIKTQPCRVKTCPIFSTI